MDEMTIKETIAVLQAAEDGNPIQYQHIKSNLYGKKWFDLSQSNLANMSTIITDWNFSDYRYRIKPEPREFLLFRHIETDDWSVSSNVSSYESLSKVYVHCIKVREVLE